jgi:hypothetical protein
LFCVATFPTPNRGARRSGRLMGFRERGRFRGYCTDPDEVAVMVAMDV